MLVEGMSKWFTLGANVALLIGLGLVAYELNQNTQLARTTLIHEGNALENQIWANLMGEVPGDVIAKSVECPELMTYADFVAMDAFLFTSMNMIYREYELAKEGLFTSDEWKREVRDLSHWYLGNDFGRIWWKQEASNFFDSEFSKYVDVQLELTGSDSYEYWRSIRDQLLKDKGISPIISKSCLPEA